VAAVEAVVQGEGQGRVGRRPWLRWVIRAIVVAVAAFAVSWLWLSFLPPVQAGSVWAVIGEASGCPPVDIGQDDETVSCHQVAFQEGAPVGIGFTVRNTGPLAVTIESVEPIGLEPTALAVLQPQLITTDYLFGADAGRPFDPVEVAPNREEAIQLVGTFVDCRTAASNYVPDSGTIATQVRMRVRWFLTEAHVTVPLSQALELMAPDSCK
jgi:hypothetical protein